MPSPQTHVGIRRQGATECRKHPPNNICLRLQDQHVRKTGTALALLNCGERFDLMLSDILMPGGMSGLELAQKVRQHFPWLPILLSIGYARPAAEVHQAGFEIIAKPYNAASLLDAIIHARASVAAGESAETA